MQRVLWCQGNHLLTVLIFTTVISRFKALVYNLRAGTMAALAAECAAIAVVNWYFQIFYALTD
jgi:hypothetical protein